MGDDASQTSHPLVLLFPLKFNLGVKTLLVAGFTGTWLPVPPRPYDLRHSRLLLSKTPAHLLKNIQTRQTRQTEEREETALTYNSTPWLLSLPTRSPKPLTQKEQKIPSIPSLRISSVSWPSSNRISVSAPMSRP